MPASSNDLLNDVRRYVTPFGVRVTLRALDIERPGEFDGPTVTINPRHDRRAAAFYLAHSIGSVVQWSTDFPRAQKVVTDIRAARAQPVENPDEFARALDAYRRFEEISSEHAVWMLQDAGHANAIGDYTVFFRADIAAMTIFHRTGRAPRWREFYTQWRRRAKAGDVWIKPFEPRPFGWFTPVKIETQEVMQERD